VVVSTDPDGASVFVDGQIRGVTPLELNLPAGEHRVRVAKDGYLENSRVVRVTGAAMAPVKVSLTRAQVEEPPADQQGGGGSGKKIALIGLGVVAVGAGVFLATRKSDEAPTVSGVTVTPSGAAVMGATNVTFSAQATDPDGDPITYSWNFGDGASGSGQSASHVYNAAGSFQATVTATAKEKSATGSGNVNVRSLAGRWTGNLVGGGTFNTVVNLAHSSSTLTGNYADQFGSGTVSGRVSDPRAVTFTVSISGFQPFTFTGTVDAAGDRMTGTANGSGFVNASWTLSR
jgi:hypothetical protein